MKGKAILTGSLLLYALGAGLWAATPGAAHNPQQPAAQPAPHRQPASRRQPAQTSDEGERIFEQNCSRCHNTPEGFSTRISGTIVRHMRMRANLSQQDEEMLFKYFNP